MTKPKHVNSYYAASAIGLTDHPALEGEVTCDVCIVGGGYSGLSTALHLAEAGMDVVLLEAELLGWGASGRNGGQVGTGQRRDQEHLEAAHGRELARKLWDYSLEAAALVRDLVRKHEIPCDYKPGILHCGHNAKNARWLMEEADHLRAAYGYEETRPVSENEMRQMVGTERYFGGRLDSASAHLHPLNFALGLANAASKAGARLFEGSRVTGISDTTPATVRTASGTVRADHVVIACNGYLEKLEPRIAGRIMPINNFVLATEPLGEDRARELIRDDVGVQDTKYVIDYFRLSADKRLLFGGGENYTTRFPADIKSFVRKYMLRVYPQLEDARIDYAWGGTLAITLTRMPCFGRLPPNRYYILGYSGHGVPTATFAGNVLAEAIKGDAGRFDTFAKLQPPAFPGGTLLRWPALVVGMLYHSILDRF